VVVLGGLLIALAMLLQRFDPVLEDANYELDIKETLTIKPEGFKIKVRRRKEVVLANTPNKKVNFLPKTKAIKKAQERLLILYGSNSGASESFANQLASEAQRYGFDPTIGPMDAYINQLEKGVRLFIVTASYEGKPPHNAAGFMSWLESLEKNELEGIEFTVLGCGHRDWVQTYQVSFCQEEKRMQEAIFLEILRIGVSRFGIKLRKKQPIKKMPSSRSKSLPIEANFYNKSRFRLHWLRKTENWSI